MDELEEIARSVDGFALTLVPEDEEGFITARLLLLEGNDDANEADFLICGPPAMVAALDGQLRDAGVPPSSIHAERFGFGPRSGG
jgi:ferredoxin-NADP reductase